MKFQRRSTIERGYEYYEDGRVSKLKPVIDGSNSTYTYSAEVRGTIETYHTEVTLDKHLKLIDGSCSCLAFETYDGPCKHIAAVAYQLGNHLGGGFGAPKSAAKSLIQLEVGSNDPASGFPGTYTKERATSSAVLQCMDQLEVLSDSDIELPKDCEEKVRIVPTLIWDKGQLRLELTLGTSRQYVVRSLKMLCKSLNDVDPLLFGKGLRLTGDLEQFDDESRPIVEFLLRQYLLLTELHQAKNDYSTNDLTDQLFVDSGRAMILTPQALDEFLDIQGERPFHFDKRYRFLYGYLPKNRLGRSQEEPAFCTLVKTREGDPLLPLELIEEPDGITLKAKALPFRCEGRNNLYALMDSQSEILWKTSRDYRAKMTPFLTSLERSDREIFIANHDLTRFCVNVFTSIRQWLDIAGDVSLLERYMPWDMEGQLYLDSPAPGVITARPYTDYGVVRINLVNERQEPSPSGAASPASPNGSAITPADLRRNDVQEQKLCRLLDRHFTEVDLPSGMMILRDDDDLIYEFLKNGQAELASHFRLFVTDRFQRLIFPAANKMTAGVSLSGQLLNVTFDLENFPPEELGELLSGYRVRRRYHKLKNGSYLSLEDGAIRDAMELASGLQLTKEEMNAGRAQIPRYRALYVDEAAKHAEHLSIQKDESFTGLIHSLKNYDSSGLAIPESLDPILRDYQKTGYRWLRTMNDLGFGGILADDMGLGKTLEVITLLTAESEAAVRNSEAAADPGILALVVCPASLVWNWAKELERFSPGLIAVKISGSAAQRKKELAALRTLTPDVQRRTVVITSYDLLKRDLELYSDLYFHYHIIDEAQYIKNFTTKNAKAVNALRSDVRFALTGTPIENRLSDLWSIFHFLMPGYLGNYQQFKNTYERPIVEQNDDTARQLLQAQVAPFVLRRLKQNVLKELPEKVESVISVPLEGEQQKLYMANLAKAKLEVGNTIAEGGFETNQLEILAILTRLRQICCHPGLCYEDYRGPSAKLDTCMELIHEAIRSGHRILLFSQFTSMLSLIEERLRAEDIDYYLLTGQTPKSIRQRLVTSFNDGQIPVFLISLKAGGTGLNLTGADVVIHFDPWWIIAAQNQATDRAHRIGQKQSVQVYKLVADDTIEEKILKLQAMKGDLASSVITDNSDMTGGPDETDRDLILKLIQEAFL